MTDLCNGGIQNALSPTGDDHLCAAVREQLRRSQSNAARSARDQSGFAVKNTHMPTSVE
jgi:hypothetical protein